MHKENCGGSPPALNRLDYQSDEKRTPLWDRDRLGNDPQWVPGFLSRCSWVFPEQLRDKSELVGSGEIHQAQTKHPNCVTPCSLNLFEAFFNLLSMSSETWEMFFWAISGSSVFCEWLFLVFSGVSLETAANFLSHHAMVAMILRKKFCQLWGLNWSYNFYNKSVHLSLFWGTSFNENKQLTISTKWVQYQKASKNL